MRVSFFFNFKFLLKLIKIFHKKRDKKFASLFLISIINLLIAKNEQDLNVDLVIQLVLSRLAITCGLDRSIDSEDKNFENLFQSFFNQVNLFEIN